MTTSIQLVECPRDAWQGLPGVIPAAAKADYLRALIDAGFTRIDAVSFVSPRAVPQMADSEQVLTLLKPRLAALNPPRPVEIIAIVVNVQGTERAIRTGAVTTLGFPYSISPEFLRRNQHQTPEESLAALQAISAAAHPAGLGIVAYLSMAFGNPYGDAWSIEKVIAACHRLIDTGAHQISLADTVGLATPEQISEVFSAAHSAIGNEIELGLHLHARPDNAAAKVRAAYLAGCRRFDAALGGFGGCPFAQDALVGNIATETALTELARLGAEPPQIAPLGEIIAQAQVFNTRYQETEAHTAT